MVLLKDVNFSDPAYPSTSYLSEWINLEGSAYIIYTVYCDQDCDVQISWAFNNQFQVTDTDVISLTGGTTEELVVLSKNLFGRFSVQNIASTPADLKLQVFFYEKNVGLGFFENVGSGARVLIEPSKFRTFVSSDGSVTITENAEEIDLVAGSNNITLGSAGGTYSVVNDGVGPDLLNKGLNAGANITIVDNGTNLEISSAVAGSTVWQEDGSNTISPQTVGVTQLIGAGDNTTNSVASAGGFVIGGQNNTNPGGGNTEQRFILGGDSNTYSATNKYSAIINSFQCDMDINSSNARQNTIISSSDSFISGGGGGGRKWNGVVCGSDTCTASLGTASQCIGLYSSVNCFAGGGRANAGNGIYTCIDSSVAGTRFSGGIFSDSCAIQGANGTYACGAICSDSCTISANRGSCYCFIGSTNCSITQGGGGAVGEGDIFLGTTNSTIINNNVGRIENSSILGGFNNIIDHQSRVLNDHIIGSRNSDITISGGTSLDCVILGGEDHSINSISGTARRNTIIGGENGTIGDGFSDCWLFTHGTAFSPTSSGQFVVKNTGGTYVFSNNAGLFGVTMPPNTAGWISRGGAPSRPAGTGAVDPLSTDSCGRVTGIGAGSFATLNFATAYPVGSLVNVTCTIIGAPTTAGSYPYITTISNTSFTINNPDTGSISVSYIVMASD